jgi:hypothetical protein
MNQAAFLSIQGLWAGPWLADVMGLPREAVAGHLFAIAVAMTFGFLGLGAITAQLARSGVTPAVTASMSMGLFGLSLLALALRVPLPPMLTWCVFGFFGTSGVLLYAHLTQQFPKALSGRVITSLNVFAFGGAFLLQWGMGAILDRYPGASPGSYQPAGYQAAFGVILALQLSALLWMGLRAPRRRR